MKSVVVYWRPTASKNGNVPQGILSAKLDFGSFYRVSYTQKIQSLKDILPPDIILAEKQDYYLPEITLDFGIQTFKVEVSRVFYYPGLSPLTVNTNEWTLPNGWKTSSGNTGIFITSTKSINVVTDYFGTGTIKMCGVNDCFPGDKSEYSKIEFKRKFSYVAYPHEINYGVEQVLKYSVSPVNNVSYIWEYPNDWSIVSGANTNTITLSKPMCSTNALVRVKMKNNLGGESDWFECPNKSINPPKMSFPSEIEQYQNIGMGFEIPTDQIQMLQVYGDGVEVRSGMNTSNPICSFYNTGSIKVNCILVLKNCNGKPYNFTKNINVTQVSNLSIDGPNSICGKEIVYYSLLKIPSDVRVSWIIPNELKINSGQNTSRIGLSANSLGKRVAIVATLPDGQKISRNINAGTPSVTQIVGSNVVSLNTQYQYRCTPFIGGDNSFTYVWESQPAENPQEIKIDRGGTGEYINATFYKSGYYTLLCYANSGCGIQPGLYASLQVQAGLRYSVSVLNGILAVTPNDFVEKQNAISFDQVAYQIINSTSGVQKAAGKISVFNTSHIDVQNLSKGVYVIKIELPHGVEIHKIIL